MLGKLIDLGAELDGIAGADKAIKSGSGDLGEDHFLFKIPRLADQNARSLGESFDDERMREFDLCIITKMVSLRSDDKGALR